jgi:hypothetical protein
LTSNGLLHREVSRVRVSQFCLKIGRGAMAGGARDISQRLHRSEVKDSRFDGVRCSAVEVEPNYPSLDVIFLLAHRDILVF